jgi:zinc transport system ATP-binding protein
MNVIDVSSLSLSLSGTPVLRNVSFTIGENTTVALLGPNGAGKSTLIRAILKLTKYDAGTVTLFGRPLAGFTSWDQIGYVPQRASVSLHCTTVAEVVGSGTLARHPIGWIGRNRRRLVAAALDTVGLIGKAREPYLHLSGGQQQRVLIARGIVNHPRLIVMDEPFAGVDLANQAEIANALSGLTATILVVLHETGTMAATIGHTIVLNEGRVAYDGPPVSGPAGTHEWQAPDRIGLMSGMEPRWTS